MRVLVVGATGEVGTAVAHALQVSGHTVVPVSSRSPLPDRPEVIGHRQAIHEVQAGAIDLVVNGAGPGDRRKVERDPHDFVTFAQVSRDASIPSVLVSTTRVLEGYDSDFEGDAQPRPTTPYGAANAASESAWLSNGGMSVLRLTNFFCAPASASSPQSLLLPWSLATEGFESGGISVRSGRETRRQFIDASDVVSALLLLAAAAEAPRFCATSPGVTFTLEELTGMCQQSLLALTGEMPVVQFGSDSEPGPECLPGWLDSQGWRSELTATLMETVIEDWLRDRMAAERRN